LGCSDCSDCHGHRGADGDLKPPPVPIIPDIHSRVYDAVSQPKALDMSAWHTCETTHCRAGWVVALAGEEGKALEAFHNTDLAARMIYEASGYKINPARFHDSNEAALEDMRQLALGPVASTPTEA
jgi:hypothetical protein